MKIQTSNISNVITTITWFRTGRCGTSSYRAVNCPTSRTRPPRCLSASSISTSVSTVNTREMYAARILCSGEMAVFMCHFLRGSLLAQSVECWTADWGVSGSSPKQHSKLFLCWFILGILLNLVHLSLTSTREEAVSHLWS